MSGQPFSNTHSHTRTCTHLLTHPPTHSFPPTLALLLIFLWSKVADSAQSFQSVVKLLKTPTMTTMPMMKSTTNDVDDDHDVEGDVDRVNHEGSRIPSGGEFDH